LTAPDDYFRDLRRVCDLSGAKLIFDEIQTGVFRTGPFSISEHFGIMPDFITLAKSLGSGIPVGAVLTTDEVAATVGYGDQGTTFGGGMMAMRAMQATLETIRDEALMLRAPKLFDRLKAICEPHAKDVRGRGCLIGVELHGPAAPVVNALRERGVIVGGSGHPNTFRLMPPLNTSDAEVEEFAEAFLNAESF
jgi:acetylornithine/succinyldiaminopimelate/putrescine aminotransferase